MSKCKKLMKQSKRASDFNDDQCLLQLLAYVMSTEVGHMGLGAAAPFNFQGRSWPKMVGHALRRRQEALCAEGAKSAGVRGGSPRKNFSGHAPLSPGNAPFYIRGGNTHPYASKICTCTQRENPLCSKILDQNLVFKCFCFKSETLWRHFMIAINLAGIMPSS